MAIEFILNEDDLAEALRSDRAVLYKHSNACAVCITAKVEVERFSAEYPDVDVYLLDVREQRPLSQKAASHLDIPHESPQVVVILNGQAVWHASHFDITAGMVAAALRKA